jgi:predicted TIM-barrel fold metal-dependent hydrolase
MVLVVATRPGGRIMQYRRISADCHLDLVWLPHDLFTSQATPALKDQMPYVAEQPDGSKRWVDNNGTDYGKPGGVGVNGVDYVPGRQRVVDKMHEAGLFDDYTKKGLRRPGDPHLRVKELDRDGVDAEVIYGILAACAMMKNPQAANEMLRIYNDFMNDFCSHYPDRLIGLACLPYSDIAAAAAEVRRVAKLGVRGVELSCSWHMSPMWHPMWDPLWEAVNEVQLPLHFHSFPIADPDSRKQLEPPIRRRGVYSSKCTVQTTMWVILTGLMAAAVFERYPNIRVVLGESGIGWIPHVLEWLDFEYEDQFRDLQLKLRPSEYWRRQCKATFQCDRIGLKLLEEMGVETVMWGSDYPHPDGVWPESDKAIEEQFGHLPVEVTHKMTCENASKFYGLINS